LYAVVILDATVHCRIKSAYQHEKKFWLKLETDLLCFVCVLNSDLSLAH